jgi:DNA-binding NarL/FixJ family response regulator
MVTFTSAVAAVRCAVAVQRATTGAAEGLEVRIGIDAGEPLSEAGDLYGTPVIVASRLCDAAGPGEVLATHVVSQIAGPRVAELMRPAGSFRVKGISESVATALVRWREDDDGEDAPPGREQAPMRPITVVIADDQRLLRTGFRVILDAEPDVTVVGEAADGYAAVDVVARRRPDVVLMDIRMPVLDGIEATRRIVTAQPNTRVLILTTFGLDTYVYDALRAGASGFMLKDAPPEEIAAAVQIVARGDALLAPAVTRAVIEEFARQQQAAASVQPPAAVAELTPREHEVFELLARGLSNPEICKQLVITEATAKTHVARILQKLDLRDRVQAVIYAYETGLVAPGSSH